MENDGDLFRDVEIAVLVKVNVVEQADTLLSRPVHVWVPLVQKLREAHHSVTCHVVRDMSIGVRHTLFVCS